MAITDRLIQLTLRARNYLSGDLKPASDALKELTADGAKLKDSLAEAGTARSLLRALRDNQQATESLRTGWNNAQATLDDLTREIGDNEKATAGQRIALREARATLDEAERAYRRNQSAIRNTTAELTRLGVDTRNISAEEQRLSRELDDGKRALEANRAAIREKREEERKAAEAARLHAERTTAVSNAMSGGVSRLLAFAAAFVSIDAAIGLVRSGIGLVREGIAAFLKTGDDFERLDKRLASLMGSAAAGEKAVAWIKRFAKDTPLEVADVTEAFALLKSYGLDPMDGTLQSLVDKNEQLGGGMERLSGLSAAVGQAFAKQKLQTEEILQLVERGVPAWTMLEKITGKNASQLEDLASKGRLGRDVIKALVAEMGKSAKGAAAQNMSTLTGLVSNLSDVWADFLNRIAKSGALDYAKTKLKEVAATIEQMDKDGRLDKLAKSISTAFEQGGEKLEEFATKLAKVDFNKVVDDSTTWLGEFGQNIDKTVSRIELLTSPVRAAGNVLTGFMSSVGAFAATIADMSLAAVSVAAQAIPDMLGGEEMRKGLTTARETVRTFRRDMVDSFKQDAKDMKDLWKGIAGSAEESADKQAEAAGTVAGAVKETADAVVDHAQAMQDTLLKLIGEGKVQIGSMASALELIGSGKTKEQLEGLRKAMLEAFQGGKLSQEEYANATGVLNEKLKGLSATVKAQGKDVASAVGDQVGTVTDTLIKLIAEGKVGLAGMAQALELIDTAKSREQVEQLRKALLRAFQDGKLTQDEYQNASGVLAGKLRDIGKAAGGSAELVSKLDDALGNLKAVQQAIASAKTDVDINKINAALRKLYGDGDITARQYNEAVKQVTAKQKEMKAAVDASKKSQDEKNASDREAIATSEELRKASGERMEAERQALGQSLEEQRKGAEQAKRNVEDLEGYFGDVVSGARQPLAELSEAALEAFDRLQGISTADIRLDTSSLTATTKSLQQATDALAAMEAAASAVGMSPLGQWQAQTMVRSQRLQVQFLEEKRVMQELMEQYESGGLSARDFISAAEGARNTLSLLNDSDMRTLEGAIESAKQRMQQLQEGSKQTLASLQEELMGLRGETEALERSRFASRKAELQSQYAEAQKGGDMAAVSNLQRALSTLAEIEAESAQKTQREAQQRRVDEINAAAKAAQPVLTSEPDQTLRILSPSGKSVDVSVPRGGGDDLLRILEEAGLRSAT